MRKLGSLCSGYGGLDMAVRAVLDTDPRWFADVEPAAIAVHAHHWPQLANLGDITAADWEDVEPVEVLTAGYPCQPFSLAGQRKGAADARHLWPSIAKAVRVLRPGLVVLENVAGHRSKGFGDVLADLAAMGYRAAWGSVRASEVGAPHRRERVFIVAANPRHGRVSEWARRARRPMGERSPVGGHTARGSEVPSDGLGPLLPTPAARDYRSGLSNLMNRNARPLNEVAVMHLLPTPTAADGMGGRVRRGGYRNAELLLMDIARRAEEAMASGDSGPWREFGPAVRHWERVFGWRAPAPTVPGARAARVLNPELPEWMMGLLPGHVTAVPGLTRTDQIKLIGNGVCPQQGATALRALLSILCL